jgi:hypothetical protein
VMAWFAGGRKKKGEILYEARLPKNAHAEKPSFTEEKS